MECPKCGNTKFRVMYTNNEAGDAKVRVKVCYDKSEDYGCGLIISSTETVDRVKVYDPEQLKDVWIDIDEYKQKHRKADIEGRNPFQQKMFNE